MARLSLRTASAALVLGVAALGGATFTPAPAEARGTHRMVAVDYTQGGRPVITDNGVNDRRVCKIFFKRVYDPWTEMYKSVKTKQCI